MKRFLWLVVAGLLGTACVARGGSTSDAKPPAAALEAAKAITKITGVAISPLLGTAAVGAYDYFTAPKEKKTHLPWYAHPYFWIPALLIIGVIAAKDAFGVTLPPGLKKPLDVAETLENKVSGVVATGAFVPIVASFFGTMSSTGGSTADVGQHFCLAGLATFQFSSLLNILTVPLAMCAFVLVWLLGHVINILILISPFGVVDAALKSFRTFLMGLVTVTSFVNPWAGAVLSIAIIVLAYFLAGWSFRLTVFGSVYIWDFITGRRRRFKPAPNANWMFTARKIEKTPIRTYGRLVRGEKGELSFQYRPLLFAGPSRTVVLPGGSYAVGRGLFHPEVMLLERGGEHERTLLTMPPRYRTHEDEVAKVYGIADVHDVGLLRGFKAIWNWLKGLFGLGARHEASAST